MKITQIQTVQTGGGWEPLAAVALVVLILAGAASALTAAVAAVVAIVHLILMVLLSVAAFAVFCLLTWLAFRHRQRLGRGLTWLAGGGRPSAQLAARPQAQVITSAPERPVLTDGGERGLNVHLHGADAVREWARQMRGES